MTHNIVLSIHTRGVDRFFQILARLSSSREFSLAKSENDLESGEKKKISERETLAKLASGF
jgi:hypothetical protein